MATLKFWMGSVPSNCDACSMELTDKFYDAKTKFGPWGNLCPACHTNGPGLGKVGTGLGQGYTKQDDGRWLKTAG